MWDNEPMTVETLSSLSIWIETHPYLVALAVIWSFLWKGLALWKSAGLRHKYWFLAILFINTLGLLEIIYLFVVSKGYKVEVSED